MSRPDSWMDPWSGERGRLLLRLARESVAEALGLGRPARYEEPWLRDPGACFVTLRRQGDLRGCVGSVRAYRPLFDDVWSNARASAFRDTRFRPVEPWELPEISVEVSLLSAPEPLACSCEEDALGSCVPASTASSSSTRNTAAPSCRRSGSSSPIPATSWTT